MPAHRTPPHWVDGLGAARSGCFFAVALQNIDDPVAARGAHAGPIALATGWFMRMPGRGLASRPGPKLPGRTRRLHPLRHRLLGWGMLAVVLTGLLAGIAGPLVPHPFGAIALLPGIGGKILHGFALDALLVVILAQAAFRLCPHSGLRDNALGIMLPTMVHRVPLPTLPGSFRI